MRSLSVLFVVSLLVHSSLSQWQQPQWTAQQWAAYHQQNYNNWYWQQQRQQQQQQQQATTAAAPSSGVQQHPVWGRVETDDKGNMWVGDDVAKVQIISRYSPPE